MSVTQEQLHAMRGSAPLLVDEVETLRRVCEGLSAQLTAKTKEYDDARVLNGSLALDLKRTKDELKSATNANNLMAKAMREADSELTYEQGQVATHKRATAAALAERDKRAAQVELLNGEIRALRNTLQAMQRELEVARLDRQTMSDELKRVVDGR